MEKIAKNNCHCERPQRACKRYFVFETIWPLPVEKIKCLLRPQIAFTLAEVLITLTIIGIIAALTIPNLMQKWQDHADVVKVKTAYSKINQSIKMAFLEEGDIKEMIPNPNFSYNPANGNYAFNKIIPYFKTAKICGVNTTCNNISYKNFNGVDTYNYTPRAILSDGVSITYWDMSLFLYANPYDTYGTIAIDINGEKGPNRSGYDLFYFEYNKNGIIFDTALDVAKGRKEYCKKDSTDSRTGNMGKSCSYWVIKHGNMDYKYRDISAEW